MLKKLFRLILGPSKLEEGFFELTVIPMYGRPLLIPVKNKGRAISSR